MLFRSAGALQISRVEERTANRERVEAELNRRREEAERQRAEAEEQRREAFEKEAERMKLSSFLDPTIRAYSAEERGGIGTIGFNAAQVKEYKQEVSGLAPLLTSARDAALQFTNGLADGFARAIVLGESFSNIVRSLIQDLAQMFLRNSFLNFADGLGFGKMFQAGGVFGPPANANGTRNFAGGLTMVGERGRELISLPRGSNIYSNPQTEKMMAGSGVQRVEMVLSGDIEGRILNQANKGAVRIVQQASPAIVQNSVQAVGELNSETGSFLARV